MRAITILKLLDRLEELLGTSYSIPLMYKKIVDEEKLFAISNKIRESLPDDIKLAIQIQQEAEKIKEEAKKEAERIKREAEIYAEKLVATSEIMRRADEQAKKIIEEAQEKSNQICKSADEYVLRVLKDIEERLNSYLIAVRKGIEETKK